MLTWLALEEGVGQEAEERLISAGIFTVVCQYPEVVQG